MAFKLEQVRRLTIALIISGAGNVTLLAFLVYWTLHERPPIPYFELKPANYQEQQSPLAIDHSNSEVIRYFKKMPLEWLIARLKNTQLVENGYTQRDLALASLTAFHHFDLTKALSGLPAPSQKRSLVYGKFRDGTPAEMTVYPGLSDKYFDQIVEFAAREKWPLTSQGLFLALRKNQLQDPSLIDAFIMTPEFLMVEMLFARATSPVEKKELLEVLMQGDWTLVHTFADQQRAFQDFSPARRQRFLLDYINKDSAAAAFLILKTEGNFAAQKLDDAQVMHMLKLLETKSPEAQQFASTLLTSPRSDEVWKMAASRLYEYAGESLPENLPHQTALTRFVPANTVIEAAEPQAQVVATVAPPIVPPAPKPVAKPQKPQTLANAPAKKATPKAEAPKPVKVAANTPKQVSKPVLPAKENRYIVQEGDTLWKISQRYKIDMRVLKTHNKLESDRLKPGTTLRIPASTKK